MKRRKNLKALPIAEEKLSWDEIERLAGDLANELMMAGVDTAPLMLLMQEITRHPFDHSHVETIAILLNMHLFARTPDADAALDAVMEAGRRKLKGGAR